MPNENLSEGIIEGLKQAIDYKKGDRTKASSKRVSIKPLPNYDKTDIKAIRKNVQMTQKTFALFLGVSIKTVESWETGTNTPSSSSLRLLQLIESDPTLLQHYVLYEEAETEK